MWENKSSGYSLIEVAISLAILLIITVSFVGMCTQQHASSAKSFARSYAQKDIDQLVSIIKRDVRVQLANGLSLMDHGAGLQIKRISPNQDNPAVAYTVAFQSVCVPFKAEETDYAEAYTDDFRAALSATPQSCLTKLNCSSGTYPAVQITTQGENPLSYQPSVFPTLGKSLLAGPVGLALCVQRLADQISLRVESVMIEGQTGSYRPQVVTKVYSISLQPGSDLVLLQPGLTPDSYFSDRKLKVDIGQE